ncbi:MAG: dynamin family protein [Candidatus Eremiobacteraeota bacterium]|nr:dynamin family protein [Candidatus Eremiobacteraeota bacterium]
MSKVDSDAMRRYEEARDEMVARFLAIERYGGDDERDAIALARSRLQSSRFVLAVVGEFSSGKSFLLNALLGKYRYEAVSGGTNVVGLLATDINPSTATITELEYGKIDTATAIYENGRTERIPLDRLNRFISVGSGDAGTMHDATKDERDAPSRVVVTTDSPFLERGFVVADTPGLASINPAHRRATLQFLPSADAVLYLIDTQQPFTEGDASFLGIVRQHIDSIFIVQTKIDLWQQRQSDGRTAWEHANERISALAAIHAPGTYVYALSAREYAEGRLENDPESVARSRFPQFLSALDASLIRRTGRSRLRRALERVRMAVLQSSARIDADLAALELDEPALAARRAAVLPLLEALEKRMQQERDAVRAAEDAMRRRVAENGDDLREELERALGQAFDTSDVARLRDRQRLHIIVDRVFARVVEEFAVEVARGVTREIDSSMESARAAVSVNFALGDAAAAAFDAEAGSSLWSGDLCNAVAATIVLEAIGGPAIGLVDEIAIRFASRPAGRYMKREMTSDLRSEIFPRLSNDVRAFAEGIGARLARIYEELSEAIAAAVVQTRDAQAGSIDRALIARRSNSQRQVREEFDERRTALHRELDAAAAIVERFLMREAEIAPADPGSQAVRLAHADASFDLNAYDQGLRPSRWRVAVLGALRRGKSGLINAFAGKRLLTDDIAGSVRFPIHVRYGEREQAFLLPHDGQWREIPFETASAEAANSPVLVLLPWSLPRELVLVHAPAFDSGDASAEDINVVAASHASEVLCLFSRQLSDRELALYERIAEFNKPMLFAHTIADNESAGERRHVVELAGKYLRERNIAAQRIFTVSAHEYADARASGRAAAGWNEIDALKLTLAGHAESHMQRLDRMARAATERNSALHETRPNMVLPDSRRRSVLARIFGKGR